MKRFWQTSLMIVAALASVGMASAQDLERQSEIGSYQAILNRAGYGDQVSRASSNWSSGSQQQQGGFVAPLAYPQSSPEGSTNRTQVPPAGDYLPPAGDNCGCGQPGGCGQSGCGQENDCGSGGDCGRSGRFFNRRSNRGSNSIGSSYVDGECSSCEEPSFEPRNRRTANWVVGVYGVTYRRDYEDNYRLGYNGAGDVLTTNDADHNNMTGFGTTISRRNCEGTGWEAVYWGIDQSSDVSLSGPSYTYLSGLDFLNHVPSGATVLDIYDQGTDARLYRDTEIHNLEFNLLRNGGSYTTRWCRSANFELLAGFRLFKFDETMRYVSNTNFGAYPTTMDYTLESDNTLAGFQFGARNEICIRPRLRLSALANVGIFNNRIETRQRIFDETGYVPVIATGPSTGRSFDYSDTKDDVAFLGQLELGLIYQLSCRTRIRSGYRALGVSGVALAANQIPYDFTDAYQLQRANSNGSLLLHGFYYGLEYSF